MEKPYNNKLFQQGGEVAQRLVGEHFLLLNVVFAEFFEKNFYEN